MNMLVMLKLVQLVINVHILYRKYQVNSQSYQRFLAADSAAIALRSHFFRLYQQNKYSALKVEFRQTSDRFERVLEATKLAYANKTKESVTSLKLGSHNYLRIANARLHKAKSAISPLFHDFQLLFSASNKANFFGKKLF